MRKKQSVKCLYSGCKNTLHFAFYLFDAVLSEWTSSARARTHARAKASAGICSASCLLATLAVGRDLVGECEHHIARHEVAI